MTTDERGEARQERTRRLLSPSTWRWSVVIPWTLALIMTAAAVTFAILWLGQENERDRIAEVEQATQRFVTALTNFSAETIERDVEEIKAFAVGEFADEVDTFFGPEAVEAIEEAEASSEGQIEAIFVQDIDDDFASVFAVVNETVTNAILEEPQSDILRLEVRLTDTNDGWKVNNVDVFQSPGVGGAPGLS